MESAGIAGCFPMCWSWLGYYRDFSTSSSDLPLQKCVGSTSLCVMPHCVQSSHEIWQTPLADQPKVVVPSTEMINHGALILPLLPTPGAQWETGLKLESLRGMFPLEALDFRRFKGWHHPEVVEVLGQSPSHHNWQSGAPFCPATGPKQHRFQSP